MVGGLFVGASVPFHPSRIFHDQSSTAVFWACFLLGLVAPFLWFTLAR